MPDLRRPQLIVYAIAGLLVVLAGGRWVRSADRAATGAPAPAHDPGGGGIRLQHTGGGEAVVHVAGEVRRPGVYHLGAATRVQEAVRRAGGPTRRADLDAINLAAKVEDGRQIIVPARQATGGGAAAPATPGGADGAPTAPVNLNTATAEELGTLDGVGPATAAKILSYRQEHGGFGSVDELDQVPGIGAKRLAALRPHVAV